MPPKFKFTREEIIQAALDLTRKRHCRRNRAGTGGKTGILRKADFQPV